MHKAMKEKVSTNKYYKNLNIPIVFYNLALRDRSVSLKQRPDVVIGHNVPVRKVPDEEFYHAGFLLQFAI